MAEDRRDDRSGREWVGGVVSDLEALPTVAQERLIAIARDLREKGMPQTFIAAALTSTAEVLRDFEQSELSDQNPFNREQVRRFVEAHALVEPPAHPAQRSERKREERERLHHHATLLLREARQARGRHEIKKMRNLLLKLDQRELRRVLGRSGDDLCRQINVWLRGTAPLF